MHPMLILPNQYLSYSWNVLKNLKGKKTMNIDWRKTKCMISFTNQLQLASQRKRMCWLGICQLFKTVYITAKTRWTNSHFLEISLFPDLFQRCKFSLTWSEIPWLFTSFGVIYFSLTLIFFTWNNHAYNYLARNNKQSIFEIHITSGWP